VVCPIHRQWLSSNSAQSKELIEPFAGGGIVSLTALPRNESGKQLMVELDEGVAAVWQPTSEDAQMVG